MELTQKQKVYQIKKYARLEREARARNSGAESEENTKLPEGMIKVTAYLSTVRFPKLTNNSGKYHEKEEVDIGTKDNRHYAITTWEVENVISGNPQYIDRNNNIVVCGSWDSPVMLNSRYVLLGSFVEHPTYGAQYELKSYRLDLNISTPAGQRAFLSSFMTPLELKNLYETYPDPMPILKAGDIDALMKVKGLGPVLSAKLISRYKAQEDKSILYVKLDKYHFTPRIIEKLAAHFNSPEAAVVAVEADPYCVAHILDGVGFATIDNILLKAGLFPQSPMRLAAYVRDFLQKEADNHGNSYVYASTLQQALVTFCGGPGTELVRFIDDEKLNMNSFAFEGPPALDINNLPGDTKLITSIGYAMRELQNKDIIRIEPGESLGTRKVYLTDIWSLEDQIAFHLTRLKYGENNLYYEDWEELVANLEKRQGFEFDETQKAGIKLALDEQVCLIAGGAGCGKSSLVAGVLAALPRVDFAQCALSGKASARLQEVTGAEGFTIHRLLKFGSPKAAPGYMFEYNEINPLPYELIILDEVSLVGGEIFLNLLKAIATGTKLIILGDLGQLPAIGSLNIAHDLFYSDFIPTVELTTIHRQAAKSGIISTAYEVRNQRQITERSEEGARVVGDLQDMTLDISRGRAGIREKCVEYFKEWYHSDLVHGDIFRIQLIAPVKSRGESCVNELNREIQALFNPIPKSWEKEEEPIEEDEINDDETNNDGADVEFDLETLESVEVIGTVDEDGVIIKDSTSEDDSNSEDEDEEYDSEHFLEWRDRIIAKNKQLNAEKLEREQTKSEEQNQNLTQWKGQGQPQSKNSKNLVLKSTTLNTSTNKTSTNKTEEPQFTKTTKIPHLTFTVNDVEYYIHVGDKVMCIKNNYRLSDINGKEVSVFNGWTGLVVGMTFEGITSVYFPIIAKTVVFDAIAAKESLILGYATTVHKCVTGDTLVYTNFGIMPIEKIYNDWRKLQRRHLHLDNGICLEAPTEKVKYKNSRCLKITTEHGFELTGTLDHGIDTFNPETKMIARKNLEDLKIGDTAILSFGNGINVSNCAECQNKVYNIRPTLYNIRHFVETKIKKVPEYVIPEHLTPEIAEFLGFISSNTYYNGTSLKYHSSVNQLLVYFKSLLYSAFGYICPLEEGGGRLAPLNYRHDIFVKSNVLKNTILKLIGSEKDCKIINDKNYKNTQKYIKLTFKIPEVILIADIKSQIQFLRGIFADCVVFERWETKISYQSAEKENVKIIQYLLTNLGIVSHIATDYAFDSYPYYEVIVDKSVENARAFKDTLQTLRKQNVSKKQSETPIIEASNNLPRSFLFDKIVSIKDTVADTYCVTMPYTHQFLQNNFLGYNCQGSDFPVVIGAIDYNTPPMMLDKSLIYTLITRAKKECILVAENAALRQAIKTNIISTKRTFMPGMLDNYSELGRDQFIELERKRQSELMKHIEEAQKVNALREGEVKLAVMEKYALIEQLKMLSR